MTEEQTQNPESQAAEEASGGNLRSFGDVKVEISAMLGSTTMPVEQFLKLGRGAIVELDQHQDSLIDVCVNSHLVARGEVTVIDENVGVTIKEIVRKKKI